jgi:rhodanese-related sulfurtransferase
MMRWKQFFTPVKSINYAEGQELTASRSNAELTILDVRQPNEYEAGHIPGAKLIPLPDLMDRLDELDTHREIMVY